MVRSDVGGPASSVGIDCKDSLQWERELSLWKVDGTIVSSPFPDSIALRDEGEVGAAESGGLFVLRLNVNLVLGRDAERISSKVCSNKPICCTGVKPFYSTDSRKGTGTHRLALPLVVSG